MINRYQTLWLGGGPKVSIPVSQYDTMWRFVFSIINGSVEWTIPAGATAVLNGRKPDGNVIAISGTIADNKVTVDATEQMTVVAGEVVCELSIMSGGAVVGTANFTLAVEDAPKKDGEPISESDLSAYAEMIEAAGELVEAAQEIIEQGPFLPPGGTPGQVLTKTADGTEWDDVSGLPDGGSNGQVLTKTSSGAAWSNAGTPTQTQTNAALADYLDEHPEAVTNIPDRIKQALLSCFQKVAWVDAHGQDYYNNLRSALYNAEVVSISAVFSQGSAVIYDVDDIDDLRQYLTVTASYDDGNTTEVVAYELSGTLEAGTSTITVSYGEKTTTFDVTVTQGVPSGYVKYDFVEYTGASSTSRAKATWIELKKYADLNAISTEFRFLVPTYTETQPAIIGRRSASGATSSWAFYVGTSGAVGFHLHGSQIADSTYATDANLYQLNVPGTIKVTNNESSPSTVQVNNNSVITVPWANSNVLNLAPVLFSNPVNDQSSNLNQEVQLGSAKFFDISGNRISHYVPVLRTSDNRIGMYDVVDGVFYTTATASYSTRGNSSCIYAVGNWG